VWCGCGRATDDDDSAAGLDACNTRWMPGLIRTQHKRRDDEGVVLFDSTTACAAMLGRQSNITFLPFDGRHPFSFPVSFISSSSSTTACFAKHVNDKAAKWAASKRPKKKRLSDINRKPVVYALASVEKPPEFTVSGN